MSKPAARFPRLKDWTVCISPCFLLLHLVTSPFQGPMENLVIRIPRQTINIERINRRQCSQVSPAPTGAHAGQRSTRGEVSRKSNTKIFYFYFGWQWTDFRDPLV